MARFETAGLESLMVGMNDLSEFPDSTIDDMLLAAGEIIAQGHKDELQSRGLVKTSKLKESIKVIKVHRNKGSRYVLVYPSGSHHTYTSHSSSSQGKGTTKIVTNNDVGFVHEFGAPKRNIPASEWMRTANMKNIDKAVDAETRIYDDYLLKKGF